jgi:hypothetical protein
MKLPTCWATETLILSFALPTTGKGRRDSARTMAGTPTGPTADNTSARRRGVMYHKHARGSSEELRPDISCRVTESVGRISNWIWAGGCNAIIPRDFVVRYRT